MMSHWMKCITLTTCTMFFSLIAHATGYANGKVVMQHSNWGGFLIFKVENSSNFAACAAATEQFMISLQDEAGRFMAAQVLSAQAQNRTIEVNGTGQCTHWSNRETVKSIIIY